MLQQLFTEGGSGKLLEHLFGDLKLEGSRQTCAQCFSVTPPDNSGGAENSAEVSGTNGIHFFALCTKFNLQQPVWVAGINVTACNSVKPCFPLHTFRANSERIFSDLKRENQFLFKEICKSE
jgi:hypothetical protein